MNRKTKVGQKYGRLKIIKKADEKIDGFLTWDCLCDCGKTKNVKSIYLLNGRVKSCGCLRRKHGKAKFDGSLDARFYRCWANMKVRCFDKNNPGYQNYGGRGITVCDEWIDFVGFKKDMYEEYKNYFIKNKETPTIDRINNDGDYTSDNCRWVPMSKQYENRRSGTRKRNRIGGKHLITFNNKTQSIRDWSNEIGINENTLWHRLNDGRWSLERALTEQKTH